MSCAECGGYLLMLGEEDVDTVWVCSACGKQVHGQREPPGREGGRKARRGSYQPTQYAWVQLKRACGVEETDNAVLRELLQQNCPADPLSVRQALRALRASPKQLRRAPAYAAKLGWEAPRFDPPELEGILMCVHRVEVEFAKLQREGTMKRRYMIHYPTVLKACAEKLGHAKIGEAMPRLICKGRRERAERAVSDIFARLNWPLPRFD